MGNKEAGAEEVAAWLSGRAVRLRGVEPEGGFEDLGPLKETLDGVRVVGLGEATHGTREFFAFKHRMLRFLVEEMGFTALAIEASHAACLDVDDYVLGGTGDPARALHGLGFWTWDTEEVLSMIEWMRTHNREAPRDEKVRFFGFDMQLHERALEVVSGYLAGVAPPRARGIEAAFRGFEDLRVAPASGAARKLRRLGALAAAVFRRPAEDPVPDPRARALAAALAEAKGAVGFLEANGTDLVQRTSAGAFERALGCARVLAQAADVAGRTQVNRKAPRDTAFAARDRYMAENVQRILASRPPGDWIALWAHNGHVSKGDVFGGVAAMGSHLRRAYGEAYYALGFCFDRGSFQARRAAGKGAAGAVAEHTVGPAVEGSVDWYLARAGAGDCLVDLRGPPADGPVARWLFEPRPMRSVGAVFSRWHGPFPVPPYAETVPGRDYDGLAFFGRTTRARPNPGARTGTRRHTRHPRDGHV